MPARFAGRIHNIWDCRLGVAPYVVATRRQVWSGARDLNPGPHGPEPHGVPSRHRPFDGFQLETSDARARLRPDLRRFVFRLLHEVLHRQRSGDAASRTCAQRDTCSSTL